MQIGPDFRGASRVAMGTHFVALETTAKPARSSLHSEWKHQLSTQGGSRSLLDMCLQDKAVKRSGDLHVWMVEMQVVWQEPAVNF